jgi:two-component system, OmpR family, response regulator VanR
MAIGCRVLVLEDDPQLLELLTSFLGDLGHTVCPTASSDTALELIKAGGIELSLVDVGAHGLRVARAAASRNIPCLMMSGRPVIFEIGGLGEVMQKPIKLDELRTKIDTTLRNTRARISTSDEKLVRS